MIACGANVVVAFLRKNTGQPRGFATLKARAAVLSAAGTRLFVDSDKHGGTRAKSTERNCSSAGPAVALIVAS